MFKFGLLIVVCITCVLAKKRIDLAPDVAARITQAALQCASETGVDMGSLIRLWEKKNIEDENVKKFFLCAFRKVGIATKNGDLKMDKFLEIYPDSVDKNELKAVAEKCIQKDGEPADKIFNFLKCYAKNTPVHINMFGS